MMSLNSGTIVLQPKINVIVWSLFCLLHKEDVVVCAILFYVLESFLSLIFYVKILIIAQQHIFH